MVYDRDYIQNSDIKQRLSDVTGIPVSNLDKILLDGKILPVIVLNKYDASMELLNNMNIVDNLVHKVEFDKTNFDEMNCIINNTYVVKCNGKYLE